jgi:deoxyribonuclease IV
MASTLFATYGIGSHMGKKPNLLTTVQSLPKDRPSQIFLGGPQSSNLKADDTDMVACAEYVSKHSLRVFVHSQYIINLATRNEDDMWHLELLKKNLRIANKAGLKGVVVHVGKSVKLPKPVAVENMRKNILDCLEAATEVCPLLLETPAGQGTELLTKVQEFADFMKSIDDPRLKVCLDTCHVFAAGCDPMAYLNTLNEQGLLGKLILVHFNDSKECCGSCKDRHELPGLGHIGLEKLTAFAARCAELGIPMVIE